MNWAHQGALVEISEGIPGDRNRLGFGSGRETGSFEVAGATEGRGELASSGRGEGSEALGSGAAEAWLGRKHVCDHARPGTWQSELGAVRESSLPCHPSGPQPSSPPLLSLTPAGTTHQQATLASLPQQSNTASAYIYSAYN